MKAKQKLEMLLDIKKDALLAAVDRSHFMLWMVPDEELEIIIHKLNEDCETLKNAIKIVEHYDILEQKHLKRHLGGQ